MIMNDLISKKVTDLQTPSLVIYKHIVQENAQRMLERAQQFGVSLRPHIKTTKCIEAILIQTNGKKECVVVSTIPEAEMLYSSGFKDVLYGVPLCESKVNRCAHLCKKMQDFSVMIDREEMVDVLETCTLEAGKQWSVFIEVDCDNCRSGILYSSKAAVSLALRIANSPSIKFRGLYAHCGNSYCADNLDHVYNVASSTTIKLLELVAKLEELGVSCPTYGIGSTPTCSNPHPIMKKLTEWHPGNYILYDVMQMRFGSCSQENLACFVLTRVIGHYPQSNHMLVDCGFLGLSLHGGGDCYGKTPGSGYGLISGHPELKLYAMKQEHGLIKPKDESSRLDFPSYPIGTLLRIYPDHSCATCAMHRTFYIADKSDKIIEEWKPVSGW